MIVNDQINNIKRLDYNYKKYAIAFLIAAKRSSKNMSKTREAISIVEIDNEIEKYNS